MSEGQTAGTGGEGMGDREGREGGNGGRGLSTRQLEKATDGIAV